MTHVPVAVAAPRRRFSISAPWRQRSQHRHCHRRRLDPDRGLRTADRAARPTRADRRSRAKPLLVVPLRHRRARPRRLLSRHLRIARLAADRADPGLSRDGDRDDDRRGSGHFRGPVDGVLDAADRPRLRLPGDHPRDGRRRGARPRPLERCARDRRRRLAVVRARRRAGSCSRWASPSTCSRRGCSARRVARRCSGTSCRTSPARSSCSRHSTSRTRSCSSRASHSSGSGRSRRRRSRCGILRYPSC